MNEKIPTRFLKLKELADVPRAEYMDGPSPAELRDAKKRKSFLSMLRKAPATIKPSSKSKNPITLKFNAAAWVRVPKSKKQLISLVISYKDTSGEYAVVVDEDEISEGFSLMLTGCVTIMTKGTPEFMKVCVAGLNDNQLAMVDDLYIQKIELDKLEPQNRKIA